MAVFSCYVSCIAYSLQSVKILLQDNEELPFFFVYISFFLIIGLDTEKNCINR